MLILTREVDQRVMIDGGRIVVTVTSIRGNRVRLGFEAAPEISIHRSEVFEAIKLVEKRQRSPGETGAPSTPPAVDAGNG